MRFNWTRALVVLATIVLAAGILAGLGWLLLRVGSIVVVAMSAILLTYALLPLVDFANRWLARPLAVLVSYLAVAGVLAGVGALVAPPLVGQANQAVQDFPSLVDKLRTAVPFSGELSSWLGQGAPNGGQAGGLLSELQSASRAAVQYVFALLAQTATLLTGLVLVLVVTFYLLTEGRDFRRHLEEFAGRRYRPHVRFLGDALRTVVGGYIRGQLLVAATVGVLAGIAGYSVGLAFPLVIASLAALLELIPFFGPVLSAVPAVIIALVQGPTWRVLAIVGAFVIIQQLESNVIQPRITGHVLGLHPLVIMFSVLIGLELAGVWGALFGVPVVALLVAVARHIYDGTRTRRTVVQPEWQLAPTSEEVEPDPGIISRAAPNEPRRNAPASFRRQ